MSKIQLDIKGCGECPYHTEEKVYTADSFEDVSKYICTKNKKIIKGYVSWNDEVNTIPDWCPLLMKEKVK